MQQWEYLSVLVDANNVVFRRQLLAELGYRGWELVTAHVLPFYIREDDGREGNMELIFKKPHGEDQ